MGDLIQVGVFGAGRIGRFHINNLRNIPTIKVKKVFDIVTDHLHGWAEEMGIELTENEDEIFDDPDIDAIFIFTPTNTHVPYIIKAAKAKKNIFCEKPVSFSDEEVKAAYDVVNKNNVKIQMGFNRRFDGGFMNIKNAVTQKRIGDLQMVKITSRDPETPSLDYIKVSGGIFMDMMIHDFDMARYISGSEVEEVYATGDALINPEIRKYNDIDTAVVTLKFRNGAFGVIDNSRQAVYGYDQRVEAFGSKGMALADNPPVTTVRYASKDTMEFDHSPYFFMDRYKAAYTEEYRCFSDSLLKGTPIVCKLEDGIMAQRIAKAAGESLKLGQPVKVENLEEFVNPKTTSHR